MEDTKFLSLCKSLDAFSCRFHADGCYVMNEDRLWKHCVLNAEIPQVFLNYILCEWQELLPVQ